MVNNKIMWVIKTWRAINRNKQFGGNLLPSAGGSTFLWNIDAGIPNYTAS
jgi:hypothetical protein